MSLAAFVLGCAAREPSTTFFVLGGPGRSQSPRGGGTAVYVRRVEIPAYLARTSLATMKGGIEVEYASSARWAEPLDQGIARAVADSLSRRAGLRAFSFNPEAPPPAYDYDIRIRIEKFEGNDNGDVTLQAHWEITTADSSEPIASRRFNARRGGWRPGDYAGLVHQLSDEVDAMSREISRSIAR